ncbi:MAG: hypothetical protein LQ347_000837 [Umbilicaria vellea]|nr:MAG: hypothetical protein LQ347_000837 [Umbilicaria vellea]
MASPPLRDPITCHVLDQTTGLPAPNLAVTLTVGAAIANPAPSSFHASTSNTDGRITSWTPALGARDLQETLCLYRDAMIEGDGEGPIVCGLTFDTLGYFGVGQTFFPEVEIRFYVDGKGEGGHWHAALSGTLAGMEGVARIAKGSRRKGVGSKGGVADCLERRLAN